MRLDGLTPIELLIVIAIILILIAIALPNFLNAQVRAKIVRARSECGSRFSPSGARPDATS